MPIIKTIVSELDYVASSLDGARLLAEQQGFDAPGGRGAAALAIEAILVLAVEKLRQQIAVLDDEPRRSA